jgi:hypothetical protein
LTKRKLRSGLIWTICIAGPLLALTLDLLCNPAYYNGLLHTDLGLSDFSDRLFGGYKIGPELILLNGLITFAGLWLISFPAARSAADKG